MASKTLAQHRWEETELREQERYEAQGGARVVGGQEEGWGAVGDLVGV